MHHFPLTGYSCMNLAFIDFNHAITVKKTNTLGIVVAVSLETDVASSSLSSSSTFVKMTSRMAGPGRWPAKSVSQS